MDITRRDALLGATAAAAVTGLTVVPLAMKAGATKAALAGDPALKRRYAEWEAAHQAFCRALHELEIVERKAWAAADERGIGYGTEACKALMRKFGIDAAHDRESRTSTEEWEAYERFLNTPANSLQDMAWKLRTAQKNEDSAANTELVEVLSRDFERLVGEARS